MSRILCWIGIHVWYYQTKRSRICGRCELKQEKTDGGFGFDWIESEKNSDS